MERNVVTLSLPVPGARTRTLATGLAIGALAAVIATSAFGGHPSVLGADTSTVKEHTITVSGVGRIVVTPDVADLRIGVTVTRGTVKEARAVAADQMTKVIAALKKLGIADRDIQTTGLSLSPNYRYDNTGGNPRITGYSLSNAVAITVRDIDKIGDAVDDSLAAGASTLDSVSFRVDDPAKAQEQARAQAMAQAKSKAQALASAAGVSITGVASISETAITPVPPIYYGAMAGALAKDTSTPVQVGTNDIEVTVNVEYLIG
jgi:uncharacterized protein YggE